ncbi:MAG: hypothetical protein VW405_13265 [Rhodospirillaceae bacterium]
MSYREALRAAELARVNYQHTARVMQNCRRNGWHAEAEGLRPKLARLAGEWRAATEAMKAAREAHSVVS